MSHVKTALRVGEQHANEIYADRAGFAIAKAMNGQAEGENEANARRLVACWNACQDLSTEDLERDIAMRRGKE